MPSNSVTNSEPEDLFRVIAEGGKDFIARIEAFHKARVAHEQAFNNLQLGRQTKNALDEAKNLRDSAEKALAAAREEAVKLIERAKTEAREVIAAGVKERDKALAAAAEARATADDVLATAREESRRVRNEAEALMANAVSRDTQTRAAADKLAAAQRSLEKDRADAESVRVTYKKKHADLSQFLAKLGG